MIGRFARIHKEFGFIPAARTALLLIGLIGMSTLGVFLFQNWGPLVISVAGLVLGAAIRRQIVQNFESLSWAMPTALFIYGILLFVGERFGLSREAQLILITITTVLVLDIQFWSLSDPSIVRSDDR